MSILDTINANTEQVRNGKNNVASAIVSKGGSISAAGSVPTFNELVAGVNSIDTSGGGSSGGGGSGGGETVVEIVYSAGNGAVDMTATAVTDISANDSIKVVKNTTGEVSYVGSPILPYTASIMTEDSEGHVTSEDYILDYSATTGTPTLGYKAHTAGGAHGFYQSPSYNFICVGSSTNTEYYFPFFLVDGQYKQVKINGEYASFPRVCSPSAVGYYDTPVVYDEETQLLYIKDYVNYSSIRDNMSVYKLDLATLDLTRLTTIPYTTVNGWKLHYATHGYLLRSSGKYVSLEKFDKTTGAHLPDDYVTLDKDTSYDKVAHKVIRLKDDSLIVLTSFASYSNNSAKATKLVYDSYNEVYTIGVKAGSITSSYNTWADMPDEQTAFYNDKSDGSFHVAVVSVNTSNTYTRTEDTDLTKYFLDDVSVFDPSQIKGFIIDRSGYMFAIMSSGDWILLYTEYDENQHMLGYKKVANIKTDFTPTPANYYMGFPINIDFSKGYFLSDVENPTVSENVYLYKKEIAGGEYLIQRTNNQLSVEDNLYGYGIAKENITSGEEGTVSLGLLK